MVCSQEGIAVAEPPIQKSLVEFYRPTLTTVMEVYTVCVIGRYYCDLPTVAFILNANVFKVLLNNSAAC